MKRYTFEIDGVTKFRNVSPENEQKFFDKYGEYNPTLVPEELGKSQGASLSQNNQKKDTESNLEDGSLDSQESNALTDMVDDFTGWFRKTKAGELLQKQGEKNTEILLGTKQDPTALGEAIYSAIPSAQSIDETFTVALGKKFDNLTDEDFEAYVDVVNKANAAGELTELKEWTDTYDKYRKDENVFMSTLLATKDKGATGLAQVTVQSMARLFNKQSIAAGGAIGGVGFVGGPAAAMGGFFAGANFMTESMLSFQSLLQDELTKQNLDFTADNIRTVLSDEKTRSKIQAKALARGGVIGTVEGISTLLGAKGAFTVGRAVTKAAGKGVPGRVATATAQTGAAAIVEAAGGGLGEAAGLTIEGKPLDEKEILLEAIAGLVKAPLDVAVSGGKAIINKPKYTIKGTEVGEVKFKSIIDNADDADLALMDIDVQNDKEYATDVFKRQQRAYYNSIADTKVTGEDRDNLINLEIQRTEIKRKLKDQDTKSNQNALKDIETKIDDITNKYQDVDVTTEEVVARQEVKTKVLKQQADIKLTETIKFAEQGGKVIGKDVLIADEDGDAQALYDMAKDEYNSKNPESPIGDADVQGADGFIVGDIIVINKDVASKTGQINVGAHELLHGVLTKHMKGLNTNEQTNLISEFTNTITAEQKNYVENIINERNKAGENLDLNTTEEWLTVFSDGITKGDITFNEGVFDKLKNFIQEIARKVGINKEFQNGRQVYNFMKDYQASIKKGQLSTRAIELAEGGVTVEDAKLSKSQNPAVDNLNINPETNEKYTQKEWNKSGADRALTQMERGNMLDGLIAAKYKVRPIPSDFITKVYSEITNHVRNFKVNENDSLFGWINSYLKFKAGNVFIAETKGAKPKDVKTVDIDAKTTEGAPVVQVEDTSTNMETLTDNINYFQTEVQPQNTESKAEQSKLRVELGIKNIGKSEIFRKVKTALATSKAVDDKGFLKSYEKSLSSLLEPTISKILNDPAKIKKFRRGILEAIPIKTLVQMQKFLPNKIFVKDHGRQTNLTNLSKFVEKGLLPADILNNTPESKKRRAAGVRVYERLNTTTEQFENYIDATIEGKRQKADKSGTRGNNRAKVISEVAKAIGKDATPETLTKDFVQDYLNIKDLKGKITSEKVIEKISETIDRPADLKFSVTPDKLKQSANSSANKIQENSKTKNFITSVAEKYIGSKGVEKVRYIIDMQKAGKLLREHLGGFLTENPQYEAYFQESMSGGMGISTFGVADVFKSVVGSTKESIKKSLIRLKYGATGKILDSNKIKKQGNKILIKEGNKFISFEQHVKNNSARLDLLENLFTDIQKYINDNPDSSPVFTAFVKDSSNNQNHFIRMMAPLISVPLNKNGSINYTKIAEEHLFPQNNVGTMLLDAAINNLSIKDTMKVIRASYAQVPLLEVHDLMVSDAKYTSKMPDVFWNKIVDRITSGKLKLINGLASIVRYTESGVDLNNYFLPEANMTITEYFGVDVKNLSESTMEHIIPMQNELIKGILTGEVTKASATSQIKAASKISYSRSPKQIKNNYTVKEAFDKQAEVIRKINKEIQTDLEAKGYEFVDMNKKGMSTFDFDETLIIDGENFVIATDPTTNQKIEISSGNWPIKGPELAAQGYEFNFDDFVNVRGGVDGPLLQKMKNQIKKYGPENVFILTARPQSADVAIHEWLKSKGVNIPFKNITGLADGKGEAKAMWMLDKFAEGYNDMYFVDDALPNVKAVKDVLNQLDIKSKVVQAKIKFSRSLNVEFNQMIERSKGIKADKVVSAAEAKIRGKKAKVDFFVPPAAEDFRGLIRKIIGRGEQGNTDLAWFKKALFDPFGKSYMQWNQYKQNMVDEYIELKKQFPKTIKSLKKKVPGMVYTNDTAARVYLWDKAGYVIPGLSTKEQSKLVEHVNETAELKAFADGLGVISRVKEGYIKPNEFWTVETIATDLSNTVSKIGRNQFLGEWIQNKNIVFSKENLNKLEAVYGTDYIDALKDVLYRMETGSNRATGKNKQVNRMLDWVNGSVGAIMFLNIRSAALQTISMVNFLDFKNNNIFKASKAFANQPQFWKDFMFLMNSPMLKQRRAGLQIDVSASELTKAYAEGKGKPQAIIAYLLEKGFTPTKIADSFAIAVGGSTFYRNQLNSYLKQGMSEAKAKDQAFLDFQEIAEETQQSSRPDMISMQQAGPLGRLILAFQNTPAQMTRLTKKGIQDLANRRGNAKANVSKILYFGLVQNLIFGALQNALFALAWADEEELEERYKKKEVRIANGALDTLLRGSGLTGAIIATIKNTYMQWRVQRKKPYGRREDYRIMQELMNLSPPMGSKFRKIMSAIKTEQYNKGVGEKLGLRIENPNFHMLANVIEAATNAPIARALRKANNLEEAITGNHTAMQRVFLGMGWDMWSLGVEDEELSEAKTEAKKDRVEEKKKQKEEDKKQKEKENKKKGIKTVRCSGRNSSGKRCRLTTKTKAKSWKCFNHAPFKDGMDRDGDGIKEYRCTSRTKSGGRCKNKTENKNKKCYAHQ